MIAGLIYTLIAALSFVMVLSFLVFFHELGHYSVARFFGISVDRFSIGFGKPIWRRTSKAGVEWVISRIPLGGYVKFAGDAGAASNPDAEKLAELRAEYEKDPDGPSIDNVFHFRPVWQRALVVLAGPVANFILAIILFAGIGLTIGNQYYPSNVGSVIEGSPAAAAGFEPGDKIISLDGRDARNFSFVQQYISLRKNTTIEAVVERNGQDVPLTVTPRAEDVNDAIGGNANIGRVGLGLAEGTQPIREEFGVLGSLNYGVTQTTGVLKATGTYIGRIFKGKEDGKQLGSVVKIATVVGKVASDTAKADVPLGVKIKAWAIRMAALAASISIALGVANLMPLPVLDGGHLMYYGYEAVARRPLSQEKQEFGFKIGFAILLTLFVVLTINDIGYLSSIDFS
ncbi:metalloprotease MmpA [Litorimonas cladophorae]|uniref:Metalloprotease MmpA n=1 Tax=Litorimonas cladophorae TaxID=1220491 RepID=A0A918KD29_9PROT|nr:M50 family metallopeptidase [Litorimonas cladophorae]GGX57697.1 metalloprotease MmpA [Litorimonas cladophorae]